MSDAARNDAEIDDGEVTSASEQDEQGPGPGLRSSGKQFAGDQDDD